jgi:hypothetical protein
VLRRSSVRVRRDDGEARGARAPMHRGAHVGLGKERVSGGVRPRSAVASGVDIEAVRARGRGVVARRRGARRGPTRICFADSLFEHK